MKYQENVNIGTIFIPQWISNRATNCPECCDVWRYHNWWMIYLGLFSAQSLCSLHLGIGAILNTFYTHRHHSGHGAGHIWGHPNACWTSKVWWRFVARFIRNWATFCDKGRTKKKSSLIPFTASILVIGKYRRKMEACWKYRRKMEACSDR